VVTVVQPNGVVVGLRQQKKSAVKWNVVLQVAEPNLGGF
jgi:hypothetical protein